MAGLRLPLQVGTSAFWSLTRCAALLLPSFLLLLAAVPAGLLVIAVALYAAVEADASKLFVVASGVVIVVITVLALFVWSAIKHLKHALRERPSDAILDGDELRIVGGRYHGEIWALADATVEVKSIV